MSSSLAVQHIFKTNALVKNLAVCNSDVIFLVAFMGERLGCKFNLHGDPPHYQWDKNMSCKDSIVRYFFFAWYFDDDTLTCIITADRLPTTGRTYGNLP